MLFMSNAIERRERPVTGVWEQVTDEQAPSESALAQARVSDVLRMLSSIHTAQNMDRLEMLRTLALSDATLADKYNKMDTRVSAFVRAQLDTNRRMEQMAAALNQNTVAMQSIVRGLNAVVEGNRKRQEEARERRAAKGEWLRALLRVLSDGETQLVGLGVVLLAFAAFFLVRVLTS
jgi:hypothetical protein